MNTSIPVNIIPNTLEITFELRDEKATLPSRSNPFDAGLDMTAISKKITPDFIEYDSGVAVRIPEGYVGLVFPRSSLSNYNLALCNSVGVIDHGYVGTVKFRFRITDEYPKVYEVGNKIGQLIIMPIPLVVPVVGTVGGDRGGFGSTGA